MKQTVVNLVCILQVFLLLLIFCTPAMGHPPKPCKPPCDECQRCVNGHCQSITCDPPCEDCKTCKCGTCETDCDWTKCESCFDGACDDRCPREESPCHYCDDGECVTDCSHCAGDCNDITGACDPKCPNPCTKCEMTYFGPWCRPCDPFDCEECINGTCEDYCKADPNTCLKCDGGGNCVNECDPDQCQECNQGSCEDRCDPELCQQCNGEGDCIVCNDDPTKSCCNGTCCDSDSCQTCQSGSCVVCGGDPHKHCENGECCTNIGGSCGWDQECCSGHCNPITEKCVECQFDTECEECEVCESDGGFCVPLSCPPYTHCDNHACVPDCQEIGPLCNFTIPGQSVGCLPKSIVDLTCTNPGGPCYWELIEGPNLQADCVIPDCTTLLTYCARVRPRLCYDKPFVCACDEDAVLGSPEAIGTREICP